MTAMRSRKTSPVWPITIPGRMKPPSSTNRPRRCGTCIQTLPVKHQQVIFLRFYADDSLEGIAAALGCSVGTVKSRLFHALDKLREMNALHAQFAESRMKGGTT